MTWFISNWIWLPVAIAFVAIYASIAFSGDDLKIDFKARHPHLSHK